VNPRSQRAVADADFVAEQLQAFVDERRALKAERDYWRGRAIDAETALAQRALTESSPVTKNTAPPLARRRARGNWLDNP
jgi:hypothetical protein